MAEPSHGTATADSFDRLQHAVRSALGALTSDSEAVKSILDKLDSLKAKYSLLGAADKSVFIRQMEQYFREATTAIEKSAAKRAVFNQMFICSCSVLVIIVALFGYKLYKSLMEKQLKKQEKQKANKKSKKIKQK